METVSSQQAVPKLVREGHVCTILNNSTVNKISLGQRKLLVNKWTQYIEIGYLIISLKNYF